MNDRELLEFAAKAANIRLGAFVAPRAATTSDGLWAPLDDDGDALRLAVKLRLCLFLEIPRIGIGPMLDGPEIYLEEGDDEGEAVRRAIVRAAAEVGKAMQG